MKPPVVLTGSVKTAFIVLYVMYALWGIAVFFQGLKTINLLTGTGGEQVWALLVSAFSGLTAWFCYRGMDRVEAVFTAIWWGVVVLYPLSIIYRLAVLHDWIIFPQLFIAIAYLVIPTWRFFFLVDRNRNKTEGS